MVDLKGLDKVSHALLCIPLFDFKEIVAHPCPSRSVFPFNVTLQLGVPASDFSSYTVE